MKTLPGLKNTLVNPTWFVKLNWDRFKTPLWWPVYCRQTRTFFGQKKKREWWVMVPLSINRSPLRGLKNRTGMRGFFL
jgi:hypothetical protein